MSKELQDRVGRLEDHENLFIYRRRQGLTQREYAALRGIGASTYERVERGARVFPDEIDTPDVRPLSDGEVCTILRRRSGRSQADVAAAIGVSRYWLHRMECGYSPAGWAVDYWID